MDLNKYTLKTQSLIVASQKVAKSYNSVEVAPLHLLSSLLNDRSVQNLIIKSGAKIEAVVQKVDAELPKIAKGFGDMYLSQDFLRVANLAAAIAAKAKTKIEAAHLMAAMADSDSGNHSAYRILNDAGITREKLENTVKAAIVRAKAAGPAPANQTQEKETKEESALTNYTVNLTAKAYAGQLGPVIGRTDEIRRVIQVLSRMSKNNPVLVGKPGVGRASIIEALAIQIAKGDVPAILKNKQILTLDLQSVVAGASLRGEYEKRLKDLVAEIKATSGSVILFIDEIHNIVGSGGEGTSDASSLLKPALARGEIQVLGSTTPEEYRKTIEKDKSLERRFQPINVEEPTDDQALRILRGVKGKFEVGHGVRIQDAALMAAVSLSKRYIPDRCLPDKAIDLIDEAASRLKLEAMSIPSELDKKERDLTHLKMELLAIPIDARNRDTLDNKASLEKKIAEAEKEAGVLRDRWKAEVQLIQELRNATEEKAAAQKRLEDAERASDVEVASELKYDQILFLDEQIKKVSEKLDELLNKGLRLVKEEVGAEDVAVVVETITGVPVSSMMESEKEKLVQMEERIGKRVIGQEQAIAAVSEAVRRSRMNLGDEGRPIGSFFFLGPTGVGKTELAKALAEFLFDDEKAMVRLDMSEFQEKHTVSRLIGSPPGYHGSSEGGQLTEAVRAKPFTVVLLDEIEKSHPDVLNVLLQMLDDGRLTDSIGRLVSFKNTVVIMTSNVGSPILLESTKKDGHITDEARDRALALLQKQFRPEFLGRIDAIIPFRGLVREDIEKISTIHTNKIAKKVAEKRFVLCITDAAKKFLVEEGFEPEFGARPLRKALQNFLQNPLSKELLVGSYQDGDTVFVDVEGDHLKFVKNGQPPKEETA